MPKPTLALMLILVALTGCARTLPAAPAGAEADVLYPTDRIVLRIDTSPPMMLPTRSADMVPDISIWGDGHTVFVSRDRTIRETELDPATICRLLKAASALYDMPDHLQVSAATDQPTTLFAVETGRGRKGVSVYGPEIPTRPLSESERRMLEELLVIHRTVTEALPGDAPVYEPDQVIVITSPAGDGPVPGQDWPAELVGQLTGEQAREAVRLGGLGPAREFRIKGEAATVLVVPILPEP